MDVYTNVDPVLRQATERRPVSERLPPSSQISGFDGKGHEVIRLAGKLTVRIARRPSMRRKMV